MVNLENIVDEKYWADKIANKLVRTSPKKKKYVFAAGISPSGPVHIGNFRDIITSELVRRALEEKGLRTKLIFSWDNYDRFRKVPSGIPASYDKYLGLPLSEIPDPSGCHNSYAKHFETEFEEVMDKLGINAEFISQSQMYKSNSYYTEIKKAMQKRREIDSILTKFRTKGRITKKKTAEEYYPLQVYCESCKKNGGAEITSYDEENILTYHCSCGHEETVDISKKNIGKLEWKVDWPMRWGYEEVDFEPGGEDHATPGGSFEVSSQIAKKIYKINPPLFQGYGFIGVEGIYKMSGSTGSGITPKELLKIYEPELLRWIFSRSDPKKKITLFFGPHIIRQYDEFDKEIEKFYDSALNKERKRAIHFSSVNGKELPNIKRASFRQVASFSQIVQGNFKELSNMMARSGQEFDKNNLKTRSLLTNNWVNQYSPEYKIELRDRKNDEYFGSLRKKEQTRIVELNDNLDKNWNLEKLTTLVYSIPKTPEMNEKERKVAQREFFKNVYQMLIGSDTGPRLPTFLLALGKERVKSLLK